MQTGDETKVRVHAYLNMIRKGISTINRQDMKPNTKEELKFKLKQYEDFMLTFINQS